MKYVLSLETLTTTDTLLYLSKAQPQVGLRAFNICKFISIIWCSVWAAQTTRKYRYFLSELFYSNSSRTDRESFGTVANCNLALWQPLWLRHAACAITDRGVLNAHVTQSGTEGVTHWEWAVRPTSAAFLQKTPQTTYRTWSHTCIRIEDTKTNLAPVILTQHFTKLNSCPSCYVCFEARLEH